MSSPPDATFSGFEAGHEGANALLRSFAGNVTHPQIEDKARIVRGKPPEPGGGHLVLTKEFLDGSD